MPATPVVTSVVPDRAVGRGRVTLHGSGFAVDGLSDVFLGDAPVRISFASSRRLVITIPDEMDGGLAAVRVGDLTLAHVSIGAAWATGLHQVDNPAFDRHGNLFVTYSGSRGQEAPVSIFRVTPAGTREPFSSGIVNATSMAFGPDGRLYVSSRFEGAVYRIAGDGTPEQVASDLGVACGIAFDTDGWMYVGDRSGTIFRVREGRATAFASLPRAKGTAALPPLERYLKVASYLNTLSAMARFPLPDDPATRDYVGKDVEQLMIEEFPDVRQPVTLADTQRLKAQIAAVETRVRNKLKERAGGGLAPVTPGRPAISDAEIDAFAQAASEEPAAKRLFCRD